MPAEEPTEKTEGRDAGGRPFERYWTPSVALVSALVFVGFAASASFATLRDGMRIYTQDHLYWLKLHLEQGLLQTLLTRHNGHPLVFPHLVYYLDEKWFSGGHTFLYVVGLTFCWSTVLLLAARI